MFQQSQISDQQLLNYIGYNQGQFKSLAPSFNALGEALKLQKLKGTLYPFGSFCNGFGGNTTDLDCVFLTGCDDKPQSLFRQVSDGLRKYQEKGIQPYLRIKGYISQANVPILKIYDETNQVDIDLSINNINGIINSKLLYEYSQMHPKIQQFGMLLKAWGKNNGLIVSGSLTSYSMLLLMIHFLQIKYEVPRLSDTQLQKQQLLDIEFLENNPYFLVGIKPILFKLESVSLYQLLIEFFEYYQSQGEFQMKQQCLSLHKNTRENLSNDRTIIIIDPINTRYDPSKRFQFRCKEFQELFQQAKKMLQSGDLKTFDKKEKAIRHKYKTKQKIYPQFQEHY